MIINLLFGGDIQGFLMSMLLSLPGVIIAISCHEWAHAYSAYRLGDPTARNMGRMTLDPFKHLDPVGFAMLWLVGFGWAKPVPVNSRNFKKYVRDDIIVSLAGVVTNFILAFLFTGLVFLLTGVFRIDNYIIISMVSSAAVINIGIGIFNLIPIPPLDGYHILRHVLIGYMKPQMLWKFDQYAQYALIAVLLISWQTGFISALASLIYGVFSSFWSLLFSVFMIF